MDPNQPGEPRDQQEAFDEQQRAHDEQQQELDEQQRAHDEQQRVFDEQQRAYDEQEQGFEQGFEPPIEPPSEQQAGPQPESEASSQPGAPPQPQPESAPRGPRVEIDVVEGDFTIHGGADRVLLLTRRNRTRDDVAEDRDDGDLRFSWLPDGSELRVPDGAEVLIRRVYGDLEVEELDGLLLVQQVGGDADVRRVAACDIQHVQGDLDASRGGQLRVRHVDGDVKLENYDESPLLGHISGDLDASDLPGLGIRDSVGGDVSLDRCGEVVLVGTIGGDLDARRSVVTVRASSIGGDARLDTVRGVTLSAVGGDLRAQRVLDEIEVASIGGDVTLRGAFAHVLLHTVGGDLEVEDAPRGVTARRVGGDVELDTPLGSGADYSIHAGGDITLRVRGEVNARFVAQTNGGEIRTRLPLTVERGRRRNLVGVLGRGDATVTLRSDGGDISIAAADDRFEEENTTMGDDFVGRGPNADDERSWEGAVGRHRFRVHWDKGPGHANFRFQGPFTEEDDPDAMGTRPRDFNFQWERGQGPRFSGEYEQRMNDLREKAERVARKAADQAQEYADRVSRRARETDWESIGREVRTSIEKAMADLEDAFGQVRREWETRRAPGESGPSSRPSGAQRVRIEVDDEPDAFGAGAPGAAPSRDDMEAQRRAILEELRNGRISLDEAERRLNTLR